MFEVGKKYRLKEEAAYGKRPYVLYCDKKGSGVVIDPGDYRYELGYRAGWIYSCFEEFNDKKRNHLPTWW